ncbi:MAG TPA: VWA domain-containing protein, partial [Candidatus Cloacimonadota bacterium]|nr:VWA domain-containing protein [Candidatus Cloacimonadota bacterium]
DWTQGNLDLTAFAGMDIQLGFRIMSDGSNGYLGIGIDDLRIEYNVYEESPELNLLSLNSQNFPFIYSTLSVALEGQDMSNLDETNFQVYENDVLQTNFFHVTPPSTGAGSRLVDIAFQMDNSGSMSSSIAAVSANVQNFVNNLAGSGVDSALGLCRYGQSANSGNPILEDNGVLTTNLTYFRDTVWARNTINGGYEPGYYAITQSLSGFAWRPGSQKVLIIITDETPNQGGSNLQQAIDACTANGAILFALTYSGLFSTFTPITEVTGGAVFDINSSFDAILDAISQIIVSNYIISYRSSNPYYDGVQRNLRFVLNYGNTTAEDFGMYFPGQSPQISRTQTTAAMDTQAQL